MVVDGCGWCPGFSHSGPLSVHLGQARLDASPTTDDTIEMGLLLVRVGTCMGRDGIDARIDLSQADIHDSYEYH